MNAVVDFPILALNNYNQLELEFDSELATLFSWMTPAPRPCFNPVLLEEIQRCEQALELHQGHFHDAGRLERVNYIVFGSRTPGVFNLGGDLGMFIEAIMRKDRDLLTYYAHLCVDNQYRRATGFGAGITTISLLQGKALGGGFEAALATDVIIAERSTTVSFPEILFNLFPGMGALSFLGRRDHQQRWRVHSGRNAGPWSVRRGRRGWVRPRSNATVHSKSAAPSKCIQRAATRQASLSTCRAQRAESHRRRLGRCGTSG